ncbi:class I SAM-dependent methyltransferase [Alphaproteobacteria bacterium]|nr:class I SAM-dependent methyltransferase [Alphaproteobacteria bacterium]
MNKYSKTSSFYRSVKLDYFSENEKHLQKARDQNKIYMAQPKRQCCKICETALPKNVDFNSHQIDYIFCTNCNHLNGIYDDTISFVKEIYLKDDGDNYATEYFDEKYLQRTKDIYLPKVEFLDSSVQEENYKVLDVGCGSGYFALGCLLKNISISGFDVSKKQIEFGNNRINSHKEQKKPLYAVTEEAFFDEIKNTNADVISAVGVIEHLREPQKFFKAFKLSGAKYLFYSVPMFSFSVVLENMFENVFPRQLHGDHTHLFTEQSIKELNDRLGVKSVNEWRFGADIMDLYRATLVNLQKNNSSPKMIKFVDEGFATKIDEMQSVLDMNHFCSEIHVVAAKL